MVNVHCTHGSVQCANDKCTGNNKCWNALCPDAISHKIKLKSALYPQSQVWAPDSNFVIVDLTPKGAYVKKTDVNKILDKTIIMPDKHEGDESEWYEMDSAIDGSNNNNNGIDEPDTNQMGFATKGTSYDPFAREGQPIYSNYTLRKRQEEAHLKPKPPQQRAAPQPNPQVRFQEDENENELQQLRNRQHNANLALVNEHAVPPRIDEVGIQIVDSVRLDLTHFKTMIYANTHSLRSKAKKILDSRQDWTTDESLRPYFVPIVATLPTERVLLE